jgi:hypothetical protein
VPMSAPLSVLSPWVKSRAVVYDVV